MRLRLLSVKARVRIAFGVGCLIMIFYVYVNGPRWSVTCPFLTADESVPRDLQKYLRFSEGDSAVGGVLSADEASALSAVARARNQRRQVFNVEKYGHVKPDTDILLVHVHRDAERLQYLVVSLAQVVHIDTALVVFSHTFYDDSINSLIESIKFCRYMQIFNPFSIQLNPSKFPGVEAAGCPHGSDNNCTRRDADRNQHKHHWWWQAHFVFSHLEWSPQYEGTVVFLEEDDYVLPDLLHMLNFAKRAQFIIPGLHVIALGNPLPHKSEYDMFKVDTWKPSFNKGLAFNKTTWTKISALSSYYCTYDDVNWNNSLYNLFSQFATGHTDMLTSKVPRVLSTGSHVSGKRAVQELHYTIQRALLFPHNVKATILYSTIRRVKRIHSHASAGNGGWSDLRDHSLCMSPYSLNDATGTNSSHITSPTTSQAPTTPE